MRRYLLALTLLVAGCSSEKALRAACAAGDPAACDVLGARYAYGDGVKKDPALAVEYSTRAAELCLRGDAGASPSCARRPVVSVPLDLPAPPRGSDVQTVLSVVLAADGTASINGSPVASDELILAAARAAHEKNPDLRAVIKADASVSHGRVIHVLDLLKQAQVSKIAFGVSPTAP